MKKIARNRVYRYIIERNEHETPSHCASLVLDRERIGAETTGIYEEKTSQQKKDKGITLLWFFSMRRKRDCKDTYADMCGVKFTGLYITGIYGDVRRGNREQFECAKPPWEISRYDCILAREYYVSRHRKSILGRLSI